MTDSYKTPSWILQMFSDYFDPCPLNDNPEQDGLKIDWKPKTFVNPPYSNPLPWVEKAIKERERGNMVVLLLKMDTSTRWFAKLQEAKAKFLWVNGRLKFINPKGDNAETSPAGFPSMFAILEAKE